MLTPIDDSARRILQVDRGTAACAQTADNIIQGIEP
jgi:hypothetical protein